MAGSGNDRVPAPSFNPWTAAYEYAVDAWQRGVLFADVMRQRGNQYHDHMAKRAPNVLSMEYELVLDGRELPIGEDEVILYRSEPVVQTVRVPYQRVRLVARRVERTEVVEDTLRKERVDIETQDEPRV